MATRYRIVLATVPSQKDGHKIARGLLEGRLAACVNIIPGAESLYWWKGKIEHSHELVLLIKTQKDLVDTVIGYVRENHPHDTPEVLSLPVMEGDKEYLNWLGAETNPPQPLQELDEKDLEEKAG